MISIETYLGTPGNFRAMADWTRPDDTGYVDGAIVLVINGVELMGFEEWGDVNWLWPYMINMLESMEQRPTASTYFPDQPILLKFTRRAGGWLTVEISYGSVVRTAQTDLREFLSALGEAGSAFFSRMAEVAPEEIRECNRERDRLQAVVSRLGG